LEQLQNTEPESRQFCLAARLVRQWLKERGIICVTLKGAWVPVRESLFTTFASQAEAIQFLMELQINQFIA